MGLNDIEIIQYSSKFVKSQFHFSVSYGQEFKSRRFHSENGGFYGASDLTRTGDLLITSEMHYRLCYTSILSVPYDYTGKWEKSQSFFMNASPTP